MRRVRRPSHKPSLTRPRVRSRSLWYSLWALALPTSYREMQPLLCPLSSVDNFLWGQLAQLPATRLSSRFVFRESRFCLLRFREICDSATKEEEVQEERAVGAGKRAAYCSRFLKLLNRLGGQCHPTSAAAEAGKTSERILKWNR